MPTYFFHQLTKSGPITDLEGTELADLSLARLNALQDARDLMGNAIRDGKDISSRTMQICDEAGTVLFTLPFTDAIEAHN